MINGIKTWLEICNNCIVTSIFQFSFCASFVVCFAGNMIITECDVFSFCYIKWHSRWRGLNDCRNGWRYIFMSVFGHWAVVGTMEFLKYNSYLATWIGIELSVRWLFFSFFIVFRIQTTLIYVCSTICISFFVYGRYQWWGVVCI